MNLLVIRIEKTHKKDQFYLSTNVQSQKWKHINPALLVTK